VNVKNLGGNGKMNKKLASNFRVANNKHNTAVFKLTHLSLD
jgi:hypothetical protein